MSVRGLTEDQIEIVGRAIVNDMSRSLCDLTLTVAELRMRLALAAIGALPAEFTKDKP